VLGVNLFKLLAHLKELHVPVLKDTLTYGAIHRAWYYQHPMIVVHDPDELANVRISVVVVFFFSSNCEVAGQERGNFRPVPA
jgi:hypothetical protein